MNDNQGRKTIYPSLVLDQNDKLGAETIIMNDYSNLTPMIRVKELTKVFGRKSKTSIAADHLNFTFYDGQRIAFLGANGAGKTTTIEMIAGITKPTSGTIDFLYEYINTYQETIGIQFQDSIYPSGIKVRDVISFILEVYDIKIPKNEVMDIVQAFDLTHLYKKNVRSLSGGQQQRLNILLSLIHRPKYVFLDELSTGLDISVRSKIKKFIKEYTDLNDINMVLISHDADEIQTLCDRIMILQKGVLKVDMPLKEVLKKFNSVEALLEMYI